MSNFIFQLVSNDTPPNSHNINADALASKSAFFLHRLMDLQHGEPRTIRCELDCPSRDFDLLRDAWRNAAPVERLSLAHFNTVYELCKRFQNTDERVNTSLR